MSYTIAGHKKPAVAAKVVPSHVAVVVSSNAVPSQLVAAGEKQSVQDTNQPDVFCTGYFFFPGKGPQAYLSDGSEVSPPDLQLVAKNFIVVSGRKIKIQFQRPEYVFQPPPQYDQPPALPDRPVNDAQVIVIGQNHRQPPPRLGGIESMQSQFRQ